MEWAKEQYNKQYDIWVPWLEDLYLRYFTKDNKASYATRENLDKTKVTGVSQVDNLQDGVHHLATSQVGQGGIAQPVGDLASREGVNRAERRGKDERGGYVPQEAGSAVANAGDAVAGTVASGVDKTADGARAGGKGLGKMFGFGGSKS